MHLHKRTQDCSPHKIFWNSIIIWIRWWVFHLWFFSLDLVSMCLMSSEHIPSHFISRFYEKSKRFLCCNAESLEGQLRTTGKVCIFLNNTTTQFWYKDFQGLKSITIRVFSMGSEWSPECFLFFPRAKTSHFNSKALLLGFTYAINRFSDTFPLEALMFSGFLEKEHVFKFICSEAAKQNKRRYSKKRNPNQTRIFTLWS